MNLLFQKAQKKKFEWMKMKIVTLLFDNQTKWMIKIKRISMLTEVRNKKMIYFHSALLTKTGFVQKIRPEIT
jgi:hypothetical protein